MTINALPGRGVRDAPAAHRGRHHRDPRTSIEGKPLRKRGLHGLESDRLAVETGFGDLVAGPRQSTFHGSVDVRCNRSLEAFEFPVGNAIFPRVVVSCFVEVRREQLREHVWSGPNIFCLALARGTQSLEPAHSDGTGPLNLHFADRNLEIEGRLRLFNEGVQVERWRP
jgi:hypothetical protein